MAYSNAGGKFLVCPVPVPNNLTLAEYQALPFIEVIGVGSLPESGTTENVISYDTVDQDVTDKAKGIANAGDGTLEVAYNATDPGQVALRAMAQTKFKYATARILTDAPDALQTNTILYNRGVVGGPTMAGGRNEDFIVETYQFGYGPQREIKVPPVVGTAPVKITDPAITGTAKVGEVLTLTLPKVRTDTPDRTITIQWKVGGTVVAGATGLTYTPVTGDSTKKATVEVTIETAFGTLTLTSAETGAIAA